MTTILTDSMARDHAQSLQATAAASRRARASRQRARSARRAERQIKRGGAHESSARRAAAKPFAAVRAWLVAGQL